MDSGLSTSGRLDFEDKLTDKIEAVGSNYKDLEDLEITRKEREKLQGENDEQVKLAKNKAEAEIAELDKIIAERKRQIAELQLAERDKLISEIAKSERELAEKEKGLIERERALIELEHKFHEINLYDRQVWLDEQSKLETQLQEITLHHHQVRLDERTNLETQHHEKPCTEFNTTSSVDDEKQRLVAIITERERNRLQLEKQNKGLFKKQEAEKLQKTKEIRHLELANRRQAVEKKHLYLTQREEAVQQQELRVSKRLKNKTIEQLNLML